MASAGSLERAVGLAIVSVRQHAQHDLTLGYRRLVWSALGSHLPAGAPPGSSLGQRRRVYLAIYGVEKVLPLWDEKFPPGIAAHPVEHLLHEQSRPAWYVEKNCPDNDAPRRWLALAKDTINGAFDAAAVVRTPSGLMTSLGQRTFDRMSAQCEELALFHSEVPVMVAYAALEAFGAALRDETFDETHVDYNLTDVDVDPGEPGAAWSASYAYAGGSIWEAGSSSAKRKEFWEWWLTDAVWRAWRVAE